MTATRRLAAIDIGTVTTRLLIADVGPDGLSEVHRSTDITHLGDGVAASGRLAEAAMERVADVITSYAAQMRDLDVEAYSAVATSASRDAENGEAFLGMLEVRGVRPEIVTGSREAGLSFAGATYALDGEGLLVDDIGGGSTELILGHTATEGDSRVAEVQVSRSFDVGSKRVTETYLHTDPPTPDELEAARAFVANELRPFFSSLSRPQELVSLAGTATSLAAIHQRMEVYDSEAVHGHRLKGSDVSDMLEMLAALDLVARREVVGLHPGRAPVIVAGALILETVMALAGLDSTIVSEHDILYGIVLDAYRTGA